MHEHETRALKFQVPLWMHVALHEQRILTGEPIGKIVSRALDAHFERELT